MKDKASANLFRFSGTAVAILAVLCLSVLMLRLSLPYLSFRADQDFLATKQSIIHVAYWRYSFYIHVCTSTFVLLLGVFQFIKPLAYGYKKLHRYMGMAYVFIVVVLSGPSGLIMGWFANGGIEAQLSFMLLSVLWIFFTATAYIKAREKKIEVHQQFMLRSYALTLSVITLRTYAMFLPALLHVKGKEEYVLIAWASWIPNLLVAELLIRLKKTSLA